MNTLLTSLCMTLALAQAADPAILAGLARSAVAKDPAARVAAYEALLRQGADGKAVLTRVLREAEDRAAREFDQSLDAAAPAFRKWLAGQIQTAREEALALIHDEKLYPDDAHGAVGQPLVDEKVNRLRSLWTAPSESLLTRVPELHEILLRIDEIAGWLVKSGLPTRRFADMQEAIKQIDARFAGLALVESKKEQSEIEDVMDANATGPSVASDEERRFARILDEYRVMLGLKPLALHDALVTAAQKHSQEMHDLDYFAHMSPVEKNKTPNLRARNEGYGGWVLENCAFSGDAQAAFDGWYRSSGHHRGLVAEEATQLGIGQAVNKDGSGAQQWTMMAGAGGVAVKKTPKNGDPRDVYLARVKKLKAGDVETRITLAKYCRKHELADEADKLLQQVIAIDADQPVARKLLGYVKRDGQWVSVAERLALELDGSDPDAALAEIGRRLKDDDAKIRAAALALLAKVEAPKALPHVLFALKDEASEVRIAACDLLAQKGTKDQVPALKALLKDPSFYVADSAATALWKLGDVAGVATLFANLRSGDLNHRIDAHRKAASIFGNDHGYEWDLPDAKRAQVVDEWERDVKQRITKDS